MFFVSSSLVVLGVLLSKGGEAHIDDGDIVEEHHDDDWAAPAYESFKAVTAPCCQKPGIDDVKYILVSTMSGKLVALDAANQGAVLWSLDIDGSPLLSGTLSRMPPMESNGRWYHLVPALDGSLYMYSRDDRLLEPIPLSTEVLLQSSVRIAHDAVAGGKTITTTGVDPLTGEVRYHCTAANCNNVVNEDVQSTLVLRRSTNSVRAVNALTGAERWNLSVAEYDASLVKRHNAATQNNRISDLRLLMQPPEGTVTAYDGCGNLAWNQNVGSHIVKAWKIEGGELIELSLFDAYNIHTLAVSDEFNRPDNEDSAETLFYLGMSNNDPFILHSGSVKSELQRMARHALDATETIVHQPGSQLIPADKRTFRMQGRTIDDLFQISLGRSYSANNPKSDTKMIEQHSEELTIVNPSRGDCHVGSCPNGEGISLIKEEDMRSAAFEEGPGDKGWYILKPGKTARKSPFPLKRALKQCAASLTSHVDSWWSFSIGAITGLSTGLITIGTAISYFCWRKVQKKLFLRAPAAIKRKETKETSSGTSMSGMLDSIPPTPSDATPIAPSVSRERRTTSGNSVNEDFTSKFLNDFEPVKLLGHGGFGFVFKAMNRLDEGYYAVKRIAVADNERAIQKVLREVRAMAKLDHRGLTRYYHTWIEKPPPGWQEDKDKEILSALKVKRKNLDVEETEELEGPERSTRFNLNSTSLSSIKHDSFDAPAMPDESSDGSWLDSAAGKSRSDDDCTTTDSDSDTSASAFGPSISKKKHKLEGSMEPSDGIIFGSHRSKSSKSSSENLWASNVQQVLVATVDEEVLPSRDTEHKVYLYIQMQLCQEKTLHTWLKHHKKLEDRAIPTVKGWLVQLCTAVNYIHSQGMIHRDLKPENIFFFDDDHQHLKVGDLGLVTGNASGGAPEEHPYNVSHSPHTDNVGTRGYMSPEQISNRPYTFKIDVFSLGLVFCELVIPFQTCMERSRTLGSLQRGEMPEILKNCGKAEKNMILWMTKLNPNERPTTEDILSSDYLADVEDFGDRAIRRLQSERNTFFEKKPSVHF